MSQAMFTAGQSAIFERRADRTAPADSARCAEHRRSKAVHALRCVQGVAAGIGFLTLQGLVFAGTLLFAAVVSFAGTVLYAAQAVVLRLMKPAGALLMLVAALGCIASPRVRADMVPGTSQTLLAQANYLTGSQTDMTSFQVTGAGTLSVYLSDMQWPVPLQSLTASILGNDGVLGSWTESSGTTSGEFSAQVSGAGTFDAFVAAVAGQVASGFSLGVYSIRVAFTPAVTPVPLPAALDLLLGGLGLLGAVALLERFSGARNRRVISLP